MPDTNKATAGGWVTTARGPVRTDTNVDVALALRVYPAFLRLLAAAKELRSPTFTPDDADFGLCALCHQRDYEGHSADCEWSGLREAIAEADTALKGDADAAHHA